MLVFLRSNVVADPRRFFRFGDGTWLAAGHVWRGRRFRGRVETMGVDEKTVVTG